ncbi:hypothetical protein CYLTODRAFT_487243 [Cylindrobasidium torrendii FP15055 ss-10]|uniref:Atypical/PIKK/TRRAP protein kinase n=1 Tax=Cylindrobasidium torrendii FP15055 ss-10 TaxID=1314674 RepID=A0A0D7BLP5_9AGAR|nr:hypothetical protein CYLTODRAFT_487243 [Cylindrobasidium torrendii FP15055 ss-10]
MASPATFSGSRVANVADIEQRATQILDPTTDLQKKVQIALEIREILDNIREHDQGRDDSNYRPLQQVIPRLLEILTSQSPAYRKTTPEYEFRTYVITILTRIPLNEQARPFLQAIYECLLHVIRSDNEDNAVIATKHLVEVMRQGRLLAPNSLDQVQQLCKDVFFNMRPLADRFFREDSPQRDALLALPSMQSFKVATELALMLALHCAFFKESILELVPAVRDFLAVEAPLQKAAREAYEAQEGHFWAGMAKTIKSPPLYLEMLHAQTKTASFSILLLRSMKPDSPHQMDGDLLVKQALRILQDCPTHGILVRKELMVLFRHLTTTTHRKVLLPVIDKLLDERVLLGVGIGSRETLRTPVFQAFTDLFHHLRSELSLAQLERIVRLYSHQLNNPSASLSIHIIAGKILFGTAEALLTRETTKSTGIILEGIFKNCLERLEALVISHECLLAAASKKEGDTSPDDTTIELARHLGGAAWATGKLEDTQNELRMLFKTLLHGFRVCLTGLRKCPDAKIPDGSLIFRLFEGCIRCLAELETDERPDANGIIDWFCPILTEINLHVFQEVWTHKIGFFVDCLLKRDSLMKVVSFLYSREAQSPTLLAIVLQYLVDRLALLGEGETVAAATIIRLYRFSFGSINQFPATNERILALHLPRLLLDCFPYAAKASRPTNYYILLRVLFRQIGTGGGRFELLYQQVLPLLPEILECLSRQLTSSPSDARDMIVELCLTVPLRLTHLLPHLSYLMQPLAYALRGSTDMVQQGLRTLELCIDNLTPDFLDPTLNLVLRDLMDALHDHLKPLPAAHTLSHTTIRILGKLGGRNRRVLLKEPVLTWHDPSALPKTALSFGSKTCKVDLVPFLRTAITALKSSSSVDIGHAYTYLEQCVGSMLHDNEVEENVRIEFQRTVEGLFDAVHVEQTAEQATTFLRRLARQLFSLELQAYPSREPEIKNQPVPFLTAFLDAIPHALTRENPTEAAAACQLIATLVDDLVAMVERDELDDITPILQHLSYRFITLAFTDSWASKKAACAGIRVMTRAPIVGTKWTAERENEVHRALLHVLKDLPPDLPRDTDEVVDLLLDVYRISVSILNLLETDRSMRRLVGLTGQIFSELQSPKAVVRDAVHKCLELLVELSGHRASDLLMPHRDRIVVSIYTKPLRALPFSIQIGMIEAVRYCVILDPPLIEVNEELLRLLHETLALADADDLHSRSNARQSDLEVTRLHVACIKLLTASMPLTDFFSRQHQTRQRVTSVYFKALYSPAQEIKDVAYDGLKMVLAHQARLPRELLQTGLRPILMNLADAKRLSVPGLEGLARLLELLTNYFKVEIGHKLLDHFRAVADPQMLQESSKLLENEGISKLVRLVNIFHLLPSTANMFLESLINHVVNTESMMHFSSRSPFSEPLSKYLDRYPQESIEFFMRQISFPDHQRTLRSIICAQLAPRLQAELESRMPLLISQLVHTSSNALVPALNLVHDLAVCQPRFLVENQYVIDALLRVWHAERNGMALADYMERLALIETIFKMALVQSPRVDLIFDLVAIYARNLEMDLVRTTHFLYEHVALSTNMAFRRNILVRFSMWFRYAEVPLSHKTAFIRYVVTPTLLVQALRSKEDHIIGQADFIAPLFKHVVSRYTDRERWPPGTDDEFIIELVQFMTTLVRYYSSLLPTGLTGTLWKLCLSLLAVTEDPVVKQMVHLLTSYFLIKVPGSPSKFVIKSWNENIRSGQLEGRNSIRQETLSNLAQVLPTNEYNNWAVAPRKLVYEENGSHIVTIYSLIVEQPDVFYPVRAMFIGHIVAQVPRLGLVQGSSMDSRNLSVDICQVVVDWEARARKEQAARMETGEPQKELTMPLVFRENIVSYLVRLTSTPADAALPHAQRQMYNATVTRALNLLKSIVGPTAWSDVAFGLRYFMRMLEQTELVEDTPGNNSIPQAIASAKVLHIIASEQSDEWYRSNTEYLQRLVRKGLLTSETALHDALHPIFHRLIMLYPLPKEDEDQQTSLSEFHAFVYSAVADALQNASGLAVRGPLLMLESVVKSTPERIEVFAGSLHKLLTRITRDHMNATKASAMSHAPPDLNVRLLLSILDICQASLGNFGDHRKPILANLSVLGENCKQVDLARYMLNMARTWALAKDGFPASREKATLLNKMGHYDTKGPELFNAYLQLIFDIFTDSTLRRSDLTSRLEPAFLLGCRAPDPELREKFVALLDGSIPRSLFARLTYIFGVQNWEPLADTNWIHLALQLLLGAVDYPNETGDSSHSIPRPKFSDIIRSFKHLAFLNPKSAHQAWLSIFPAAWSCLSRREQAELTQHTIVLLSKDYHNRQVHVRPSVIETLLTGIHACTPAMTLPPHLLKYLAKSFGCWHVGLELIHAAIETIKDDEPKVREHVYDSLADLYAELGEDDMFYGVWRKRCMFVETNVGLSLEQNGMWEQAATAYESAMTKARAGTLPFSESEFCLWEDHWILAAEKLQHWDVLAELGRHDSNPEMQLESAWRLRDWTTERTQIEELVLQLPEAATPRRRVFECFLTLLRNPALLDKNVEFTRMLEDSMQLCLRKWVALPSPMSAAHIPLLQNFQQFVELQEAVQIFGSLSQTNATNLEKKSGELKMVLQAWRERLPNVHDDINVWSDLVAWRQRVFDAINSAYIPLINSSGPNGASNANTYGYRGYHETAWIINRFAHVARKHDLLEACMTSLAKIYTLPNIEISEAFLKLREQARCFFQKPNELAAGLEVINNTNLHYFSPTQKAEFFTLKAMFLARSGSTDADQAFGQAAQLDMNQAKVWAEWGRYNDSKYSSTGDITFAAQATSCYLSAAGQYKNGKSRLMLSRVLWFLSVDEGGQVVKAFDTYKGDGAFWYWITLIPQLFTSLSLRENRQARYLLLNLAKHFPQGLFFHIRTTRDEIIRARQSSVARASAAVANSSAMQVDSTSGMPEPDPTRSAHDHMEEIVQLLKTAFPLLVLGLETMMEQMTRIAKPSPEEECYRVMGALLSDATQHFLVRMNSPGDPEELGPTLRNTLERVRGTLAGTIRTDFERDFGPADLTLSQYIATLQDWRNKCERWLDGRPKAVALDTANHYLTEFQYGKIDEIEVPGQYTEDKDSNQNFVRIQKFASKYENSRMNCAAHKRVIMIGSDNAKYPFVLQYSNRLNRREDKVMQLFRSFNGILERKKETRKRALQLSVPVVIACSPTFRLYQMDRSFVGMTDIFDQWCAQRGVPRDQPLMDSAKRVGTMLKEVKATNGNPSKQEYIAMKKLIFDDITANLVPDDIISKFMLRSMATSADLWRMRKQFTMQVAGASFQSHSIFMGGRYPRVFQISRESGTIYSTDMVPVMASTNDPRFGTAAELAPFRLTPNMQHFMTPVFIEGLLTTGLMSIARAVSDPSSQLEHHLTLFCREEVITWYRSRGVDPETVFAQIRPWVTVNIKQVFDRITGISCKIEREQSGQSLTVPIVQTASSLISHATNPITLVKMGETFYPWF